MRSHAMVDASVGLKSLDTIAAVREQYGELINIQLVARRAGSSPVRER
jgi:cytosine deaminase